MGTAGAERASWPPAGYGERQERDGVGVDGVAVPGGGGRDSGEALRSGRRFRGDVAAVGAKKARPGGCGDDGEAALVDEAMVAAAEGKGVVEAGLTAVEPVADVVGMEVARVHAAGEAAGVAVAGEERAAQRA
jgi:hypothetical protein